MQRRSSNKKQWPNKWDVTIGGHVLMGEFGREALIRETKEELGIDIDDCDIKYLVGSTSIDTHKDIVNKHFNECYIITKDIDLSKLTSKGRSFRSSLFYYRGNYGNGAR